MKTFTSSQELLASFSVGQGKTDSLPQIASLEAGKLTYSGFEVTVSPVWQDSYLLANLHRNLKDLPPNKQQELLRAYSENRLSLNHRFDAQPVSKTPVANHLLTSDSLKSSYFEMVQPGTVATIYGLLEAVNSSLTKEQIIALVRDARDSIITNEQFEGIKALEAKEAGLILAKNLLETAGAIDVTYLSDTRLSARVGFALAEKLPNLVEAQLEHVQANDKLAGMAIVMTFDLRG